MPPLFFAYEVITHEKSHYVSRASLSMVPIVVNAPCNKSACIFAVMQRTQSPRLDSGPRYNTILSLYKWNGQPSVTAVPNKRQCRGSDAVARKRSEDLDTKRSPVRVHRLAELGLSMGVGWRSFCTLRLARCKADLPNARWGRRDRNVEQGGEHQAHKAHVGEFTC